MPVAQSILLEGALLRPAESVLVCRKFENRIPRQAPGGRLQSALRCPFEIIESLEMPRDKITRLAVTLSDVGVRQYWGPIGVAS